MRRVKGWVIRNARSKDVTLEVSRCQTSNEKLQFKRQQLAGRRPRQVDPAERPSSAAEAGGAMNLENPTCPRRLLVCSLSLAGRSRENPFGGAAGEAFRSGKALTSCCRLAPPRLAPELVTSRGGLDPDL